VDKRYPVDTNCAARRSHRGLVAVTGEPVERGTWTVGRGQAVTAAAPRVQSCVCRNNAYRRGAGRQGIAMPYSTNPHQTHLYTWHALWKCK